MSLIMPWKYLIRHHADFVDVVECLERVRSNWPSRPNLDTFEGGSRCREVLGSVLLPRFDIDAIFEPQLRSCANYTRFFLLCSIFCGCRMLMHEMENFVPLRRSRPRFENFNIVTFSGTDHTSQYAFSYSTTRTHHECTWWRSNYENSNFDQWNPTKPVLGFKVTGSSGSVSYSKKKN